MYGDNLMIDNTKIQQFLSSEMLKNYIQETYNPTDQEIISGHLVNICNQNMYLPSVNFLICLSEKDSKVELLPVLTEWLKNRNTEILTNLIKRLEAELKQTRNFIEEGDEDDDDWENTIEYYEIALDELTNQINCLRSFENFPKTYIGDIKARVVDELISNHKSELKLKESQDSRIEKEVNELREEIKILEEILALR